MIKQNKSLADKFLISLITLYCIILSLVVTTWYPVFPNKKFAHLLGISLPLPLFFGPLLFLYTSAVTGVLVKVRKTCFLHLLPGFISYAAAIPFFLRSAQEKISVFESGGKEYSTYIMLNTYAVYLSGVIYIVWSLILLTKHKRNISNIFSYEDGINLKWLLYLIYGNAVVWLVIMVTGDDNRIFDTFVIYIVLFGIFGIRQGKIYKFITPNLAEVDNYNFNESGINISEAEGKSVTEGRDNNIGLPKHNEGLTSYVETSDDAGYDEKSKETGYENRNTDMSQIILSGENEAYNQALRETNANEQPKKLPAKYKKSGISNEVAVKLHTSLVQLMKEEKTFTDPELSLPSLAKRLETLPNYLSQIINEKEKKNFYDYINTLRVEEFIHLLSIPENNKFTISSLAYEAGFNSKSAFNKNFKKVTGKPPSDYLEELLSSGKISHSNKPDETSN